MSLSALDLAGAAMATATEAGTGVDLDLNVAIEGNSTLEMEANFPKFSVNGLGVDHNAIRVNSSTNVTLLYSGLGYNLEASDVIEFKYIRD